MVVACLAVPPQWLTDGSVPQAPVSCCSERAPRTQQTDCIRREDGVDEAVVDRIADESEN